MKSKFLLNEFFTLSISGALQRANVYAKSATSDEKDRFKKDLRNYLNKIVEKYFSPVSEADHISHIENLASFSTKHGATLKNKALSFGVSQHILNLFLKYIWCLKLIPDPPHFPLDGKIQEQLNTLAETLDTTTLPSIPWTKIQTAAPYLKSINFARKVQNLTGKQDISLAEFELAFYLNPA
ncbi:hypothetical protein MWU59_09715 [Flavobacteriaceae bacterium F08102]|nr:hypothetical protein [Flavobacteriaceae bacterium F08102]